MRQIFFSALKRAGSRVLPPALAVLLAGPAAAGEFRFLLEGEAGVTGDSDYDDQLDPAQTELLSRAESLGRVGAYLRMSYELERMRLALDYSPFYEQSLDDSEISGTSHRLDFGLVGNLTRRLNLEIRERLQSSPDINLYAPVATPETVAISQRGDQLTHNLDVALRQEASRRSVVFLGLNHGRRTFESTDLFDSETLNARLGAAFTFTESRFVEASAGLGRFEYENGRESQVGTVGVAYGRELGRNGDLRVEAGGWQVDSESDPAIGLEEGEETGWRGGIQLSRGRERVRWALGYSHDVSPGAGLGRTAEVDNAFVGLSTALGRRWSFGLDGSASRQKALDSEVQGFGGGSEGGSEGEALANRPYDTEFAAGTARLAWSFAQNVRVSGGYSRVWQRDQTGLFEDLSYDRYFLGLAFRIYATGEEPETPKNLGQKPQETDR
jgi:hypothetical protein